MFKKLIIIFALTFACLCSVADARRNMTGVVTKFGHAPSGVQQTATDIWDLANATPTQQIWIKPTEARIHAIVSSSALDDGDPVGLGARTIRIFGLETWATIESSEDIILNGTSTVNTANSYVIIHRMKVLTKGTQSINVGNIKATAATDSTITAQINAGNGQTQMAIYGVPSTQRFIMDDWYGSINKSSGAAGDIDFSLLINDDPENGTSTAYLKKSERDVQSTGTSDTNWPWPRGMVVDGPAIIKVQGLASSADIDGSAGFNGKLEQN